MTSLRGLCVLRLKSGEIYDVKVQDGATNQYTLKPDEYTRRGIKPPLDKLPDCTEQTQRRDG